MTWNSEIKSHLKIGDTSVELYLKNKSGESISYVDVLQKKHPGYLHEIFRYYIDTIGAKASFSVILLCMSERSCVISKLT